MKVTILRQKDFGDKSCDVPVGILDFSGESLGEDDIKHIQDVIKEDFMNIFGGSNDSLVGIVTARIEQEDIEDVLKWAGMDMLLSRSVSDDDIGMTEFMCSDESNKLEMLYYCVRATSENEPLLMMDVDNIMSKSEGVEEVSDLATAVMQVVEQGDVITRELGRVMKCISKNSPSLSADVLSGLLATLSNRVKSGEKIAIEGYNKSKPVTPDLLDEWIKKNFPQPVQDEYFKSVVKQTVDCPVDIVIIRHDTIEESPRLVLRTKLEHKSKAVEEAVKVVCNDMYPGASRQAFEVEWTPYNEDEIQGALGRLRLTLLMAMPESVILAGQVTFMDSDAVYDVIGFDVKHSYIVDKDIEDGYELLYSLVEEVSKCNKVFNSEHFDVIDEEFLDGLRTWDRCDRCRSECVNYEPEEIEVGFWNDAFGNFHRQEYEASKVVGELFIELHKLRDKILRGKEVTLNTKDGCSKVTTEWLDKFVSENLVFSRRQYFNLLDKDEYDNSLEIAEEPDDDDCPDCGNHNGNSEEDFESWLIAQISSMRH